VQLWYPAAPRGSSAAMAPYLMESGLAGAPVSNGYYGFDSTSLHGWSALATAARVDAPIALGTFRLGGGLGFGPATGSKPDLAHRTSTGRATPRPTPEKRTGWNPGLGSTAGGIASDTLPAHGARHRTSTRGAPRYPRPPAAPRRNQRVGTSR
jgi:hypothetical protein